MSGGVVTSPLLGFFFGVEFAALVSVCTLGGLSVLAKVRGATSTTLDTAG